MNKIGWCDLTFNPVWGCKNHCEYCYAREFANRFAERMAFWEMKHKYKNYFMGNDIGEYWGLKSRLQDFKPTFLKRQYSKKFPKKPQRIFVGSMSEIAHWEKRWVEVVLGKILCYPQHTFIFLTKYPSVYQKYDFPKNCWLGITVTSTENYNYYDSGRDSSSIHLAYRKFKISNPDNLKFISFEPLLDEVTIINLEGIDWVIIGAETGSRKDKVIPKKEWILDIVRYCVDKDIPLYLKDSIKNIYPEEIKEFPKEVGL